MNILNFGSMNIDYVYKLNHIVEPGETITSNSLEIFAGGKGLNQSIALARAGAAVYHAGMVGTDGDKLVGMLTENGVNTQHICRMDTHTGHAIIQVSEDGQNSIVLYSGANRLFNEEYIDDVLSRFDRDTMVLLQNETNLGSYIINQAHQMGMKIAFNPSPCDHRILKADLNKVAVLILNEIEGAQISGQSAPPIILDALHNMFPKAVVMLTLGKNGAVCRYRDEAYRHGVYEVPVVDSTAAGDTFTGYFLAGILRGESYKKAVHMASVASSMAVMVKGASNSIPMLADVEKQSAIWENNPDTGSKA